MAARTNSGGKFYISSEPAPDELDQAGFEGLTWIEVSRVGSVPESGSSTNILTYDTLDQEVIEKAKGMTDAGGGQLEVALVPDDPGQQALTAAARSPYIYAFKRELNDAPAEGYTPTTIYNRGFITGPVTAGGRNEDFVLRTYSLGYIQLEIMVPPTEEV